jgi:hypothetical protein
VPWLRRLVVGLTPQRPESVYVGIVDKWHWDMFFSPSSSPFPVNIIPPWPQYSYHMGHEHWWPQFEDSLTPLTNTHARNLLW